MQFMGYMPFGGQGAPLLSDSGVIEAAAAASSSSGRKVTPAQLLVKFVRQLGAVAIPRSRKGDHQRENADVADISIDSDTMMKLESLDNDTHFDWDPTDVE